MNTITHNNEKTPANKWTKYIPPNKRNKKNNKKSNDIDLFDPDQFPTLNKEINENTNKQEKEENQDFNKLFKNNNIIDDDDENNYSHDDNILILNKESLEKYKQEKKREKENNEELTPQEFNHRVNKYMNEIVNRNLEIEEMYDDLYGPGNHNVYVCDDLPYWSTDDDYSSSSDSYNDDDEYYDEYY